MQPLPACSALARGQLRERLSQSLPADSPPSCQQTTVQPLPWHSTLSSQQQAEPQALRGLAGQQIHLPLLSAASFARPASWSSSVPGLNQYHAARPANEADAEEGFILHDTAPYGFAGPGSADAFASAADAHQQRSSQAVSARLDGRTMSSFPEYPLSAGYAEAAVQQIRAASASSSHRTVSLPSAPSPSTWVAGNLILQPSGPEQPQPFAQQHHMPGHPSSKSLSAGIAQHMLKSETLVPGHAGQDSVETVCSPELGQDSHHFAQLDCMPAGDAVAPAHGASDLHAFMTTQPASPAAAKGFIEDAFCMLRPPSFPYGMLAAFCQLLVSSLGMPVLLAATTLMLFWRCTLCLFIVGIALIDHISSAMLPSAAPVLAFLNSSGCQKGSSCMQSSVADKLL